VTRHAGNERGTFLECRVILHNPVCHVTQEMNEAGFLSDVWHVIQERSGMKPSLE
jgi:hypothetical protein